MSSPVVLLWFRNDLRLADHAALAAAVASKAAIVPVFILDESAAGAWPLGGASRWWLHHSLDDLNRDLKSRGSRLIFRRGSTPTILAELAEKTKATAIYFSRAYDPAGVALESSLNNHLADTHIALKRYGGRLLREPEEIRTKTGDVYKVYTPFWKALSANFTATPGRAAPKVMAQPPSWPKSEALAGWGLLPTKPDWSRGLSDMWQPGEAGAHKRLAAFLETGLATYKNDRNHPDKDGTSRLSPHLQFGEITPAAMWRAAVAAASKSNAADGNVETFLKEIAWRDFSYTLLFHFPTLPEKPFKESFSGFPWLSDAKGLKAWQRGTTGYPIVDAGMRELWHTGYMHNRVRMITASFLIKHLLIPWQEGEAWFWDTLVDADLASNAASWQWVAGSGADAAPYFRIFNPVLQGQKFDLSGDYVRRWVPEIAALPTSVIHAPWLATEMELHAAGVELGRTYPVPIVDHAAARARALEALKATKGGPETDAMYARSVERNR